MNESSAKCGTGTSPGPPGSPKSPAPPITVGSMPALSNRHHEMFAQAIAKGASKSEAARSAGYSPTRAASQGCVLAKSPKIIARIAQLTARVSQAAAIIMAKGEKQAAKVEDQFVTGVAVTRAWVLQVLVRNIEEARADKQYAVVKSTVELAAKVAGVYVEKAETSVVWNGDPAILTEEQLNNLLNHFLKVAGYDTPEKIEAARRKAALGQTVDVATVKEPTASEPMVSGFEHPPSPPRGGTVV